MNITFPSQYTLHDCSHQSFLGGTHPRTPLLVCRPFTIFRKLLKKSYISKLCCIFKFLHELPQLSAQKMEDVKKFGKVNKLLEHLEKWLNGI
jgi:hypothetical protein